MLVAHFLCKQGYAVNNKVKWIVQIIAQTIIQTNPSQSLLPENESKEVLIDLLYHQTFNGIIKSIKNEWHACKITLNDLVLLYKASVQVIIMYLKFPNCRRAPMLPFKLSVLGPYQIYKIANELD